MQFLPKQKQIRWDRKAREFLVSHFYTPHFSIIRPILPLVFSILSPTSEHQPCVFLLSSSITSFLGLPNTKCPESTQMPSHSRLGHWSELQLGMICLYLFHSSICIKDMGKAKTYSETIMGRGGQKSSFRCASETMWYSPCVTQKSLSYSTKG